MTKADSPAPLQELSPLLSGVAGEYYVAAELSAQGYIASITLRNTKGVDILCSSVDASKSVGIQVKTNRKSTRAWMLNQKAEDYFADNLFYVFVTRVTRPGCSQPAGVESLMLTRPSGSSPIRRKNTSADGISSACKVINLGMRWLAQPDLTFVVCGRNLSALLPYSYQ